MEDNADEIEKAPYFSDEEIFTQMWSTPRAVFKYINENKYDKFVGVLLVLAGISRAFDRAMMKGLGDNLSLLSIIALCVVMGGLLGWLFFYVFAALLSWTGKWLEGKGDTQSLFRILAYATTPTVIAIVLLIPQLGIYGNEIFKTDGDISSGGFLSNVVFYFSVLVELVLSIFGIIFMVIGISEVQKVSISIAILNLFLPIIIIIVPLVILVLMFNGM